MAIMGMGKTKPGASSAPQTSSAPTSSGLGETALTGAAAGGATAGIPGAIAGAIGNIAMTALTNLLNGGGGNRAASDAAAAQQRADEEAKRKAATMTQSMQTPTTKPTTPVASLTQSPLQSQEYLRMQALKRMAAPK